MRDDESCEPIGASARQYPADPTVETIVNAMSNAVLRSMKPALRLSTVVVPMPDFSFDAGEQGGDAPDFWLTMFPLLTSLLLPSLSSLLATEKEEELIMMIKSAGGRMDAYFLGNYLFFFVYNILFSGTLAVLLYFGNVTGPNVLLFQNPVNTVLLIVVWAHVQSSFAIFVGLCLLPQSRHASIFGVLAVLMSSITGDATTTALSLWRPI